MENTQRKYDYEDIVSRAKEEVRYAETYVELAARIGVNESTMRRALKEYGHNSLDSLLAATGLERLVDVELLERQVGYLRKTVKRLEGKLSDREWLRREVAGQMAVLDPVRVPAPRMSAAHSPQEQVATFVLSDVHYGLHIPEGGLGPMFGYYTVEVARDRMIYAFQTFARLAHQQGFPVRKAVVFVLGDLIEHSHMRPVQAKETSIHVVKQSIQMSGLLSQCIRMLCGEFEEVEVHCVPGNHGRVTARAQDSMPDETFEHLIYHSAATALAQQPNLTFVSHPAWYFITDILGWKFLCLHCEDVFSWAGIPWYGVKRLVQDYYTMSGQIGKSRLRRLPLSQTMTVSDFLNIMNLPDAVCIGHFHDPLAWSLMGVEVIANGAVSGISTYSAKRLHNVVPPAQKMFFVHPDHGVGLRLPINLDAVN